MILLFLAATVADTLTMGFDHEANSLIVHLGSAAYLARGLLVVAVLALAYVLRRGRYAWVRPIMLGIGAAVGVAGAATNLATLSL